MKSHPRQYRLSSPLLQFSTEPLATTHIAVKLFCFSSAVHRAGEQEAGRSLIRRADIFFLSPFWEIQLPNIGLGKSYLRRVSRDKRITEWNLECLWIRTLRKIYFQDDINVEENKNSSLNQERNWAMGLLRTDGFKKNSKSIKFLIMWIWLFF